MKVVEKVVCAGEDQCFVTVTNIFGKRSTMLLPTSQHSVLSWLHGDTVIQDALPELSASQCEFLLTGLTDDEWDDLNSSATDISYEDDEDEEINS